MGMAADNLECYENLANAIILQAVKDYKTVLHTHIRRAGKSKG